eukprot:TRINITY_DN583_c0_g1_i2.p1 TRINITY_DN583_c0_g1~~TRINITY_DN583_c0_g1_i2.p1  ORF type:complete len:1119 (+),score=125.21 TRINITY_DN583_c0_g1_i2:3763-7119(+)
MENLLESKQQCKAEVCLLIILYRTTSRKHYCLNSFMEKEPFISNNLAKSKVSVQNAHQWSAEEVLRSLEVDPKIGLSKEEATRRLKVYGRNELPRTPPPSMWDQILGQFEDNLVRILLVAACVSFFIALTDQSDNTLAAYVEPMVILLILIANATVGVWQEMKSEKALDALLMLQARRTQVLREGKLEIVDAAELVPGDICVLHGGDRVPADMRLIKAMAVKVNQSTLTGEADAVSKNPSLIVTQENAMNQDKKNMIFSSTEISTGEATAVVVGTGEQSQLGTIKSQIEKAAEENKKTPLKEKLDQFGDTLSWIIMVICVLSWLVNFHNFFDPIHGNAFRGAVYYFKIAVSLAVAAIPEGLPAVITTCLALATARMAENKAIVRQLASVETLGCTTVICSDKTGTLTINKMTVVELSYLNDAGSSIVSHKVRGEGLDLTGKIEGLTKEDFGRNPVLYDIAQVCALCNNARLKRIPPEEEDTDGKGLKISGTATEGALKVLLQKLSKYDSGFSEKDILTEEVEKYAYMFESENPVVAKLPFTSTRKSMSVVVKRKDAANVLLLKGAPDMLLDRCSKVRLANGDSVPLTGEIKDTIKHKIVDVSKNAYRCLGFAIKDTLPEEYAYADEKQFSSIASDEKKYPMFESDSTFLGYVGIKDPPRSNVPMAIEKCRDAGIRVIMITGDNKNTAVAIGKELGLVAEKDPDTKFMDGREFDQLKDENEKIQRIKDGACIFSRVEPKHKRELVQVLKSMGEVVAMTGDGVNDAPAIRQAHIGISMGQTGTDVAKEASKLVLADDNFATIVTAVEEGRSIYSNIRAFIRYLISSNIGEVVAIFVTSVLGFPEVLSSVHLLWVNLVTDGLPATALGFNPPEKGVMEQKPRKSDEQLIGGWTLVRYFIIGTYVGIATIGIFIHWYMYMESPDGHTLISWDQLTSWSECPSWPAEMKNFTTFNEIDLKKDPCEYFSDAKEKASTLSLTVLVVIEMFNAMNSLSEHSLLIVPLWKNLWLCLAICSSMILHFLILYVPVLSSLFGVVPLTGNEWVWVLIYSAPILVLDEVMKLIARIAGPSKTIRNKEEKVKQQQQIIASLFSYSSICYVQFIHAQQQTLIKSKRYQLIRQKC